MESLCQSFPLLKKKKKKVVALGTDSCVEDRVNGAQGMPLEAV